MLRETMVSDIAYYRIRFAAVISNKGVGSIGYSSWDKMIAIKNNFKIKGVSNN
jgi:hypothetical protein